MVLAKPGGMRSPEAFVLNLRRLRMHKGITLAEIAASTNVSVELWEAMERNDFSRWPTGVAARAYVRDYASMVGADPDDAVDEFCRVSAHGDRRGYRLLRETAAVLGHELVWREDLPSAVTEADRRAAPPAPAAVETAPWWRTNLRRLVAGCDLLVVVMIAIAVAAPVGLNLWATLAVTALLYHTLSLALLGSSPTVWAVDTYFSAHQPSERRNVIAVFPGLDLMVEDNPAPDRRAAD
jgi:transcriptional regulator with XRE-family HTH domain